MTLSDIEVIDAVSIIGVCSILVMMDDKILLLYSNESAFVISTSQVTSSAMTSSPDSSAPVDLILTEAKSHTLLT